MTRQRKGGRSMGLPWIRAAIGGAGLGAVVAFAAFAEEPATLPRAFIDGTGLGWKELTLDDFVKVNGDDETWQWKDGMIHGTGTPVGVTRTKTLYTNFE